MIWSDLFPYIAPYLPGCPSLLITDNLKRAAINFCRDTHIWTEQIDDIFPVEGVLRYELRAPEGTKIIALSEIYRGEDSNKRPVNDYCSLNAFGLLTFDKSVTESGEPIHVRVVLEPSVDATDIPDDIGHRYREAFINGALSFLMMMPRKIWTNPEQAMLHDQKYNQMLGEAKVSRANGNSERPMRVAPRHLL